mmetsp:Transcript_22540/g.55576  ORF Transcript_22540/g.55576 Transcript_22540/m.55576 type:complete len:80 (-) Transcript_22540:147-386(-)
MHTYGHPISPHTAPFIQKREAKRRSKEREWSPTPMSLTHTCYLSCEPACISIRMSGWGSNHPSQHQSVTNREGVAQSGR